MTKQELQPFSIEHLNAWRMHKQRLDRPFKGKSPVDLIRSVGWIHSPGCSTPYLSIWARMSGFRASSLDRLVFKENRLVQLETLRGTTMLVPVEEAPIALQVRTRAFTELSEQAQDILPLTRKEMERLKGAVLAALESGPRSEEEIRSAAPAELVREFPSTLRRIGMSGSLRLAINVLKEEARIVKTPARKRLDESECRYMLLSSLLGRVDPFELKPEPAHAALATLYFSAEGPARIRDFAWWSGLHVTEAMRAVEAARPKLAPVHVAGRKDDFLIPAPDLEAFRRFKPVEEAVNFIPFRDVYLKGQREIAGRFIRPEHSDKPFARIRGRISNDPLAAVIHKGEVIGIWEWNPAGKGKLDFVLFDEVPSKLHDRIRKRATELGTFIRKELGAFRTTTSEFGGAPAPAIHDLEAGWSESRRSNANA